MQDSISYQIAMQHWNFNSEPKLIFNFEESQKQLRERDQVTMMKVQDRKGFEGNEKADIYAKKGSNTHSPGWELFCGFSESDIKEELRR